MKYDFEGYATKHGIKCSDGVTIRDKAFAHLDGKQVPLLWDHSHDDPEFVLGHVLLENREDGIYCFGSFNETPKAKTVKTQLEHGDYNALSIYANRLAKEGDEVVHGEIREVSIVMVGANPGAFIDKVSIQHADGSITDSDDKFVMHMDPESCALKHAEEVPEKKEAKDDLEPLTAEEMQEIYDNMSDEEKAVMGAVVGAALEKKEGKDTPPAEPKKEEKIEHGGSKKMKKNLFSEGAAKEDVLMHSENMHKLAKSVWSDVKKGVSFKESFIAHSQELELDKDVLQHDGYEYGIKNIEILFPEAKTNAAHPDFLKRDTGWVTSFINGTKKNPFTRLKMRHADLTAEEARAKGYITGNRKTEEVFDILQRTTEPTTIYKKQKLDRDNILDATDFDLIPWMWGEMRIMFDEELARACLLSDGRPAMKDGQKNPDKVNENCIRPVYKEDELYAHRVLLATDPTDVTNQGPSKFIDDMLRNRKFYKGSGNPEMFTTADIISEILLMKDNQGHYMYETVEQIKNKLRVSAIHEVEQMEGLTRMTDEETPTELMCAAILVNPKDYEIGTDKGGQITSFNQFDIDYNQEKMLLESRLSGSLTKAKTAMIYEFKPAKPVNDYKNDYYSGKDALKETGGTDSIGG